MKSFGIEVNDQVYDADGKGMRRCRRISTAVSVHRHLADLRADRRGILFAVFNAAHGREASFKQVFRVVVHAGAISALSAVFTGAVELLRGPMSQRDQSGVLLPMLPEKSFLGRLLGMIDIFLIWWLVVLAIGLAVLYRRRTQPIAIGAARRLRRDRADRRRRESRMGGA